MSPEEVNRLAEAQLRPEGRDSERGALGLESTPSGVSETAASRGRRPLAVILSAAQAERRISRRGATQRDEDE
jgi:hypothetical protein